MGGVQTFANCTFDYTGGDTFGSNQYTRWNAVNAYQENSYTSPSRVTLVNCTRINCGTATQGGGQITVK